MNLQPIFLLLLVVFPMQFFGQSKIVGTVYDEQTKQPIQFASVYIDGSTNGTMSDAAGNFHLEKIQFPCTLVVSHLSYNSKSIYLKERIDSPLNLLMRSREIKIQEVNITDKNLRDRNLGSFRKEFLGEDVWGQNATIENEDVIHFTKDYQKEQSKIYNKILPNFIKLEGDSLVWSADSTLVTYKIASNLKANSGKPLKINLPLLGYTCYYDIVEFVWQYQTGLNADVCFNLGYSYFQEQPYGTKRDSIRIQKNRVKNYYNSAQHFRKSLFEKQLAQNGYKVYGSILDKAKGKLKFKEVDLESCLQREGNLAKVIGLQGIKLNILYYKNLKGLPIDLTKKWKGISPITSTVIFINDTCIIRDTGSVPDNSIVFGPEIGLKKFGSLLPDNYVPSK